MSQVKTDDRVRAPHPVEAGAVEAARKKLGQRLRARLGDIEAAVLARTRTITGSVERLDPAYVRGLYEALHAALEYAVVAIERGEQHAPPVPPLLLAQARTAARQGTPLEVVLRRYVAGYSLFGEFVLEEAEVSGLFEGGTLPPVIRGQAAVLDRLIASVSEEHRRELRLQPRSTDERRAERIERLLHGEFLDTSEFGYEFDCEHVGAVAMGTGAAVALREIATTLQARMLLIHRPDGLIWAWYGRRSRPHEKLSAIGISPPPGTHVGLGEPGHGLEGWRLTHRQAREALLVARRREEALVRYFEVCIVASMFQDDLLTTSLQALFISPLQEEGSGEMLCNTLEAYFAADRNTSSAAAALGVSRRTVTNRLNAIEAKLGCPLRKVTVQLEAALHLRGFLTAGPIPLSEII